MFGAVLALTGCTNEFLTSYIGECFEPTHAAILVTSRPTNSGLIGTSNFVSAGSFGSPEALDAALSMGACATRRISLSICRALLQEWRQRFATGRRGSAAITTAIKR